MHDRTNQPATIEHEADADSNPPKVRLVLHRLQTRPEVRDSACLRLAESTVQTDHHAAWSKPSSGHEESPRIEARAPAVAVEILVDVTKPNVCLDLLCSHRETAGQHETATQRKLDSSHGLSPPLVLDGDYRR